VLQEPAGEFLIASAARWITEQRERHRAAARPISAEMQRALAPHFKAATLDAARVARVPHIANPDFYAGLGEAPMDLARSAGITFGGTILINELYVADPPPVSLIFHELVHVVQYGILGVQDFARRYVEGWARNDREYSRIPLEAHAYALERRFSERTLGNNGVEALVLAELDG